MVSALAVALGLALAPAAAHAFAISLTNQSSGKLVRWFTKTIGYYLHASGSADLNPEDANNQLRQGFKLWMAVPQSAVTFTDLGYTTSKKVIPLGYNGNNKNEVVFIEDSSWNAGKYVLGVTSPSFNPQNGQILEADIALNGYLEKWALTPNKYFQGYQDVLSVALHEEGHFFGLQHPLYGYDANDPPTMAPAVDPYGKTRDLQSDDQKGLRFFFPASGDYACASQSDCPFINAQSSSGQEAYAGQLKCQGGLCGGITTNLPQGTTALGGSCGGDGDCKPPLYCQPTSGGGYCTHDCQPGQTGGCETGYACFAFQNDPQSGVCLPSQQPVQGDKKAGEACGASTECASFICIQSSDGSYCRDKCSLGAPGGCMTNEECTKVTGLSFGVCIPAPKVVPKEGDGEACAGGAECESGLCVKVSGEATGFCRAKCNPGVCLSGFECKVLSAGGGACMPAGKKLPSGSSCEDGAECVSTLCVASDAAQFCTDKCTDSSICPCGMPCTQTSLGFICFPGDKLACVQDGEVCAGPAECASGACIGGVCVPGCGLMTAGKSACKAGLACQRLSAKSDQGGCLPKGATGLGVACDTDEQCLSRFCVADPVTGAKLCMWPCNPGNDACGADLDCAPIEGGPLGACVAVSAVPPEEDAGVGPETAGADAGGGLDNAPAGTDQPSSPDDGVIYVQQGGGAKGACTLRTAAGVETTPSAWIVLAAFGLVVAGRRRKSSLSSGTDR